MVMIVHDVVNRQLTWCHRILVIHVRACLRAVTAEGDRDFEIVAQHTTITVEPHPKPRPNQDHRESRKRRHVHIRHRHLLNPLNAPSQNTVNNYIVGPPPHLRHGPVNHGLCLRLPRPFPLPYDADTHRNARSRLHRTRQLFWKSICWAERRATRAARTTTPSSQAGPSMELRNTISEPAQGRVWCTAETAEIERGRRGVDVSSSRPWRERAG